MRKEVIRRFEGEWGRVINFVSGQQGRVREARPRVAAGAEERMYRFDRDTTRQDIRDAMNQAATYEEPGPLESS